MVLQFTPPLAEYSSFTVSPPAHGPRVSQTMLRVPNHLAPGCGSTSSEKRVAGDREASGVLPNAPRSRRPPLGADSCA